MYQSVENEATYDLVVRLGNAKDRPAIDELRWLNHPRVARQYSAAMREPSPSNATLVGYLPSGQLAASLQVGIATAQSDLKSNLGIEVPFLGKKFLALTVGHRCSLPEGQYLQALHRLALHMALHWLVYGRAFGALLSVLSPADKASIKALQRLGYDMIRQDTHVGPMIVAYLPADRFLATYAELCNDVLDRRIPSHEYRGEQPFAWLHH